MRTIVSSFVPFLLLGSVSAQRLEIYLNTNDCINCTSAITLLPRLDSTIAVTIYADEAKERFMPQVLGRFGVQTDGRWPVVYVSTTRILRESPVNSNCRFVPKNQGLFEFPLKELGQNIDVLNTCAHNYTRTTTMHLSNGSILSDQTVFFRNGDRVVICDPLTRSAFIGQTGKADSVSLHPIKFGHRFIVDYLTSIGKDTARYDSLHGFLAQMGMAEPTALSADFSGDTTFLLVDLRYPDADSDDPSFATIQSYPFFVAIVDSKLVGWRRCDWRLPPNTDPYLMSIHDGFRMRSGNLVMPLVSMKPDEQPEQMLASFTPVGKSIAFDRFLDIMTPVVAKRDGHKDKNFSIYLASDLFIFNCYPFFYDLNNSRSLDLSGAIAGKEKHMYFENELPRYWTWDARWAGDKVLMVLYYQDKSKDNWLAWVDVEKDKLIRRIKVDTKDMVDGSVRLLDDGRIIGLSKTYDSFIIIQ